MQTNCLKSAAIARIISAMFLRRCRRSLLSATLLLVLASSCGLVTHLPGESNSLSGYSTDPVYEPTATYKLALGGVAAGRNELVLFDANGSPRGFFREGYSELTFEAVPAIVDFTPRDGFASLITGSGAKMTPKSVGIATIFYYLDGVKQTDTYQAIIPPQKLIQILLGEARGQILDEITLSEGGAVDLASKSETAEGLGHVINNRIAMIEADTPALFNVDAVTFAANPPQSKYDATIEAENQFNPTKAGDASNDIYQKAADRSNVTSNFLPAYDQAVLTAADIFCGTICGVTDSTNGAFAFRSPDADQWKIVEEALTSKTKIIPDGIGFSDQTFPALNPIQILIVPDVAVYDDGRASFIFARQRLSSDPAISNEP